MVERGIAPYVENGALVVGHVEWGTSPSGADETFRDDVLSLESCRSSFSSEQGMFSIPILTS